MAPTPWNTSHRLDLYYTQDGLTHVYQIPVEATPAGAGSYNIDCKSITSQPIDDVVDYALLKLKTIFTASVTFTGFKLYSHVSGTIFDAVLDGSRSVAGTHAGSAVACGQLTVTMRDIARKIVKLVFLESAYGVLFHLSYPTGDTALDALLAEYLPAAAGALSFYEFAWSRGENAYRNVIFATASLNRRLRRLRGFA